MKINKTFVLWLCLCLRFIFSKAQVNLSTNFSDSNLEKDPIHDVWQIANDISPKYDGPRDEPQIRPDMKMNVIRLSGGIKNGSQKDLEYDMVRWDDTAKDYVYDFSRLIRMINKADEHGDEIYQLVIDNVPWAFQRGYTFVDLGKNEFDGVNFRKFEEIEQYGNALPPSDMPAYRQYVEALIQTLVDTFGMSRVKSWRFRIGSEIESPGHWKGTADDFIAYFDASIRAIRKIIPDAYVGVHTREPRYVAIRGKGLNYKGERFVSFHKEILEHCATNNLHLDSWGLSYYIQFDKAGDYHTNERWYNEWVADIVEHPKWNPATKINLEEFKATASFRAPDGRAVTLKSASTHGQVAHIAMSNLFYKKPELDQIHRWLQTKNAKDEVANTELLAMVGKTRYETKVSGTPENTANIVDAIFAHDASNNTYEALIYNYNGSSTSYGAAQAVNLSLVTDLPVGTKIRYRSSYYSRAQNKLQSFISEPDFQDSWYVRNIKPGQKLGTPNRVLKPDIYQSRYIPYNNFEPYVYSDWQDMATIARSDGSMQGSEISVQTTLPSFSFRKYEFEAEVKPVTVRFKTPVAGQRYKAPTNIKVEAVEVDGNPLTEMQLYLNDELVSIDSNAPYQWGFDATTDPALFNLGVGEYTLRVVAINANGEKGERQMTVSVQNATSAAIVHMTKYNFQEFALDGGAGSASNQQVKLWSTNTDNVNQQWEEITVNGGYFQYRKLNTDYCIDGGDGAMDGQPLVLNPCSQTNQNQHWQKVQQTGDVYRLQKRNAPEYSIDGQSGGENGRQVTLTKNRNGLTSSQAWLFTEVTNFLNIENPTLEDNLIEIFPNPSKNVLQIRTMSSISEDISLKISNISGKVVLENTITSPRIQLNLDTLRRGFYILTIQFGNQTVNKKLVLE